MYIVDKEIFDFIKAVAEGYKIVTFPEGRFVMVENPKATPESIALWGVDPYIAIDTFKMEKIKEDAI